MPLEGQCKSFLWWKKCTDEHKTLTLEAESSVGFLTSLFLNIQINFEPHPKLKKKQIEQSKKKTTART